MKTFILTVLIIFSLQISKNLNASYFPDLTVNNLEKTGSGKFLANWIDIQLFVIRNTKISSLNLRQTSYSAIALYESLVKGDPHYQSLAGQLNGVKLMGMTKQAHLILRQKDWDYGNQHRLISHHLLSLIPVIIEQL